VVWQRTFGVGVILNPSIKHTDSTHLLELQLLENHKKCLEYLQFFQQRPDSPLTPLQLEVFVDQSVQRCLRNTISGETITEIFTLFGSQTRKRESEQYLRMLTGVSTNEAKRGGKTDSESHTQVNASRSTTHSR
jgi:hypothetical protein